MQVVDKYGNTFGQGHLVVTTKSGKSKLPVVTVAWGNITGVLANQTDLQDALDLKVPKSRTLTINGVTQDLSEDRSWTISTGITVNTTPITGGNSGRLLFDDAGVVGETAGLNWNKITSVFTVGITGTNGTIQFPTTTSGFVPSITSQFAGNNLIFTVGSRSLSLSGSGQLTTSFNTTITGSTGGTALTVAQGNSAWTPVADFNGSSGTALRINTNGNILVGTTTDAGFRLDVNGTAAIRGITNIIGGTLRIASTGTLTQPSYITSHSDGGWNYTTYTHERGAGVHYFTSNNGSASIFSASAREGVNINVSSLNTGNPFSISGTVNASSAIARGQLINTTLVAAANNDVLVGLDIAPTYTNGAFTGLTNVDLRTKGANVTIGSSYGYGALYGYANDGLVQIKTAATYKTQMWFRPSGNAGGYNASYWSRIEHDMGTLNIIGSSYGQLSIVSSNGGGNGAKIYFSGATGVANNALSLDGPANSGRIALTTYGSSPITINGGNVLIGTTTDAGYKLDVNGTVRVKANSLTLSASGLSTPPTNYIALNFDDSPNHHQNWFAINSKKDISGIGTSYDRIIFPTMGSDNSTWQFNALGTYSRIQISARNNASGNYLDLTNSSISLSGPWTVVSIDRGNRKLVFGNMSTDVHHLSVYDIVIKGAQPFEGNSGNSNGGNVYLVGGTPSTTPAGNYGNVILAHDSTAARGNVLVGTTTNVPSAVVNVNSTTQGFLPPRMTNAQMLAIGTPAEGLMVYDTTNRKLCCYDGATWQPLF